jgi:hypothetical protein
MEAIDFVGISIAVAFGMIGRDFLMGFLVSFIQKRTAKKKVAKLDEYYQSLLDAEAAADATSEA